MTHRSLPLFKLRPLRKEKVWGYEDWLLSCHPHGLTTGLPLAAGGLDNKAPLVTLKEQVRRYQGAEAAEHFPLLVKIIQTTQFLSVQVHPSDQALLKQPAAVRQDQRGKTECWYVLEAEAEAALFLGLQEKVKPAHLAAQLAQAEKQPDFPLETLFKKVKAQAGDFFFVPAGTAHAIGAGLKLLEVQQSSDTTYRLYDFGRGRETQVAAALSVLDYSGAAGARRFSPLVKFECPYFALEKITRSQESPAMRIGGGRAEGGGETKAAFEMYFVLEGAFHFEAESGEGLTLLKEESCCFAVGAGVRPGLSQPPLTLRGNGTALRITPR